MNWLAYLWVRMLCRLVGHTWVVIMPQPLDGNRIAVTCLDCGAIEYRKVEETWES